MQRLSWNEMRQKYPDQWLAVIDYNLDDSGRLLNGIVAQHSKVKREIYSKMDKERSTAFRFTGESTFSGIRRK